MQGDSRGSGNSNNTSTSKCYPQAQTLDSLGDWQALTVHICARRQLSKPINSIVGRYLVTFSKRRVVEDGLDKMIYFTTSTHHSLADMHQFASTFTNNMHAKQFARLLMVQ